MERVSRPAVPQGPPVSASIVLVHHRSGSDLRAKSISRSTISCSLFDDESLSLWYLAHMTRSSRASSSYSGSSSDGERPRSYQRRTVKESERESRRGERPSGGTPMIDVDRLQRPRVSYADLEDNRHRRTSTRPTNSNHIPRTHRRSTRSRSPRGHRDYTHHGRDSTYSSRRQRDDRQSVNHGENYHGRRVTDREPSVPEQALSPVPTEAYKSQAETLSGEQHDSHTGKLDVNTAPG